MELSTELKMSEKLKFSKSRSVAKIQILIHNLKIKNVKLMVELIKYCSRTLNTSNIKIGDQTQKLRRFR